MKQPDLGKKISELRQAKGFTQGELAERCNLSLRTIQRIESAEVMPRSFTIKLIFESLDYVINNSFGKHTYMLDRLAYKLKRWLGQFFKYVIDLFNLKTKAMRKITTLVTVLFLIIAGILLITAEGKTQSPEQVKAIIEKLTNGFMTNFNKGDIDVMFETYRNDACILPENCCGKNCIKQHWYNELAKGYKFIELTTLSVSLSDTIAVEKGQWKIAWPSGPEITGMYLTEWRLSNDQWKIVNDFSGIQNVKSEN